MLRNAEVTTEKGKKHLVNLGGDRYLVYYDRYDKGIDTYGPLTAQELSVEHTDLYRAGGGVFASCASVIPSFGGTAHQT